MVRAFLARWSGRSKLWSRIVHPQLGTSGERSSVDFVLSKLAITAPIIGASRPEQLQSLKAAEQKLHRELERKLDELTLEYRRGDADR
jgi:aryl-alcohol dehydrogenase-like predicted oxidoreductase